MKDRLDDFIKSNRQAFDDKEPSDKIWRNVEGSLSFSKNRGFWNSVVLWRAAAVVFMVLSGYLMIPKTWMKMPATDPAAANEFKDVEAFYVSQISEKVELIDEFQNSEGLNGFTQDFKQLEAMYMILKEEMKTTPSQKVKDALVLNLLVRINLLNQQLYKLEKEYGTTNKKKNDEV